MTESLLATMPAELGLQGTRSSVLDATAKLIRSSARTTPFPVVSKPILVACTSLADCEKRELIDNWDLMVPAVEATTLLRRLVGQHE